MDFLSELKNRANALQGQQAQETQDFAANTQRCETACRMALKYLQDLCAQLNILQPAAPGSYSLDGRTPFPALTMRDFRCDDRRKLLRNEGVCDYIGVGWDLLPSTGQVAIHSVTVNFPPDLERVAQRLSMGQIKHERKDIRHPETQKLQAYAFEYRTQARGFVTLTPDHDNGQIDFRLVNVGGLDLLSSRYPAAKVTSALMDELAKKIVGQPSRFG